MPVQCAYTEDQTNVSPWRQQDRRNSFSRTIYVYAFMIFFRIINFQSVQVSRLSPLSYSRSRLLSHIFHETKHILSHVYGLEHGHSAYKNEWKKKQKKKRITLVASCIAIALFFIFCPQNEEKKDEKNGKNNCPTQFVILFLYDFSSVESVMHSRVERRNPRQKRCIARKKKAPTTSASRCFQ